MTGLSMVELVKLASIIKGAQFPGTARDQAPKDGDILAPLGFPMAGTPKARGYYKPVKQPSTRAGQAEMWQ